MITPDQITALADDQIFVFGSNVHGSHGGGAALYAHEHFGAEMGIGEGLTGQCYAFPTLKGEALIRVAYYELEISAKKLSATARALPEKIFFLTKVGCGIAGFEEKDIKHHFKETPSNIIKPLNW